jgi:hypothetical protein
MNLTSQGYYNLIVYESDPEDIPHLFERTGEHSDSDVLNWVEQALSFISDRFIDEGYSDSDPDLPSQIELEQKADKLEHIRYRLDDSVEEPYIDPEVRP